MREERPKSIYKTRDCEILKKKIVIGNAGYYVERYILKTDKREDASFRSKREAMQHYKTHKFLFI